MTHFSPAGPLHVGSLPGPVLLPVCPPAPPGGHRRPQEVEGAAGRAGRLDPQGGPAGQQMLASHTGEKNMTADFLLTNL